MTTTITFPTKSGKTAQGALALPAAEKAPAVVLLQEWWGVNDHVRSLADRLAAEGFVVLAADLYDGKSTKNPDEAGGLMRALERDRAIEIISAAVAFLAGDPRTNGKVGVTGFCMGGAYSFTAAAVVPGIAAAVPFYGIPDRTKVDLTSISCPLQAHFATIDEWAKPSLLLALRDELAAKGRTLEAHVYDAQHAFANDTRPEVYSPENAKLAWGRMVAFLKSHTA